MILDVDPGIDDAIAIITALQVNDIDVVGITTVNGNVSSKTGVLNALKVLDVVNRNDIPVIQGATRPIANRVFPKWLRRSLEDLHGKGGLGSIHIEPLKKEMTTKITLPAFIKSITKNYVNKEISVIAIGPLTNIAKALDNNRSFANSIGEICIMGGAYGFGSNVLGNVTQYAEFNFYCDPEAAKIVLEQKIDVNIKLVGLDVTQNPKCAFDAILLKKFCFKKNVTAGFIMSLLEFPLSKYKFFNLHDLFAVIMFEKPSLFNFKRGNVEITLKGKMRGHSSFKENNTSGNVLVATNVNANAFNKLLHSHLLK